MVGWRALPAPVGFTMLYGKSPLMPSPHIKVKKAIGATDRASAVEYAAQLDLWGDQCRGANDASLELNLKSSMLQSIVRCMRWDKHNSDPVMKSSPASTWM